MTPDLRPWRLVRADRWKLQPGTAFYFVAIDVGHDDAVYVRLFDSTKQMGRYLHSPKVRRGCRIIARGRVRRKHSPCRTAV